MRVLIAHSGISHYSRPSAVKEHIRLKQKPLQNRVFANLLNALPSAKDSLPRACCGSDFSPCPYPYYLTHLVRRHLRLFVANAFSHLQQGSRFLLRLHHRRHHQRLRKQIQGYGFFRDSAVATHRDRSSHGLLRLGYRQGMRAWSDEFSPSMGRNESSSHGLTQNASVRLHSMQVRLLSLP